LDFSNAIRLGANYLVAYNALQELSKRQGTSDTKELPCEDQYIWKWFPGAGCLVVGTDLYYAVMGMHKGGILKLYDKTLEVCVLDERGYSGRIGGETYCTQTFHLATPQIEDKKVSLQSPFFKATLEQMTPFKNIVLTILGLTVFHFRGIRNGFKNFLVNRLITKKEVGEVDLFREVTFKPDRVQVIDKILSRSGQVLKDLRRGHIYSSIHMASADYYESGCCLVEEEKLINQVPKTEGQVKNEYVFPTKIN
jgi:hypothetical protein